MCDYFYLYFANISSWWHITQCAHIVDTNTPKIDKILKVKINLSVLKFMYLSQNLVLKSKLQYFLLKSKEDLIIEQKLLFCGQ